MFCPKCGFELPDESRFCISCGESIDQEQVSAPVKKKPLWQIAVAALLVMALAVTAILLLTGKKTVYLLTGSKTYTKNSTTNSVTYEYDDEGRIVKYEMLTEYPEEYGIDDRLKEIRYEYDDQGRLSEARIDMADDQIEIQYQYDGKVLSKVKLSYDEGKFTVDCDDDGRIERIRMKNEDGEEECTWSFRYHNNGILKERTMEMPVMDGYEVIAEFNEDGTMRESCMVLGGIVQNRVVYGYDGNGNVINMEQYGYDDQLLWAAEVEPTYKDDLLTELVLTLEGTVDGEETAQIEILFDCEWDDLKCKMTVDRIRGDVDEAFEGLDLEKIENGIDTGFERNENGDLVEFWLVINGEEYYSYQCEYEEFKIPRGSDQGKITVDPIYFFFMG